MIKNMLIIQITILQNDRKRKKDFENFLKKIEEERQMMKNGKINKNVTK